MAMQKTHEILRHLGKLLHAKTDKIAREPLPRRWVELIHYLDDKERAQADAGQSKSHTAHSGSDDRKQ
jgi:hypothetical protein